MAENAQQPTPSPTPERVRRRPKGQKKPTGVGNLKMCLRTVGSKFKNPMTIWSDGRHKGDYYKELKQLQAAKLRIDNNPKYTAVEWAAIYDCSGGMDRGPQKFLFTLDSGWNQHGA